MDQQAYEAAKRRVTAERVGVAVPEVAIAHRLANMAVGALLLAYLSVCLGAGMRGPVEAELVGLAVLAMLVFALYAVFRLSRALGNSVFSSVFLVLLMFLPVIALIVLVVLSQSATKRLTDAGLKVGFLGVSEAELKQFEEGQGV